MRVGDGFHARGEPTPPTPPHSALPRPTTPQVSIALIVFFNYYYTFLQLDPVDLADQLKRQVGGEAEGLGEGQRAAARAAADP